MTKIASIQQLKELVLNGQHEFFISLGFARSSKYIDFDGEKFYVLNEIDDTEDVLSETELMDTKITNVGFAINKGAFYSYD